MSVRTSDIFKLLYQSQHTSNLFKPQIYTSYTLLNDSTLHRLKMVFCLIYIFSIPLPIDNLLFQPRSKDEAKDDSEGMMIYVPPLPHIYFPGNHNWVSMVLLSQWWISAWEIEISQANSASYLLFSRISAKFVSFHGALLQNKEGCEFQPTTSCACTIFHQQSQSTDAQALDPWHWRDAVLFWMGFPGKLCRLTICKSEHEDKD